MRVAPAVAAVVAAVVDPLERDALLAVYVNLGMPLPKGKVCSWDGVACQKDGYTLDLRGRGLSGHLDAALSECRSLKALNVARNKIAGFIPPEIGGQRYLTRLTLLSLAGDALTGSIPAELGSLAALQRLDLSDNRISGPLPASLSRLPLLELSLARNLLTGETSQDDNQRGLKDGN